MAQIATITVETAGGPVDLPVYEPGDSGSNRLEAFRVQTASGPGFVPLAAVDEADRPYLRVQTSSGVRAVDTSASGIPDSVLTQDLVAWYRFEDGDARDYASNAEFPNVAWGDSTAHDGTLIGGPTNRPSGGVTDFEHGANSGAFDFDGTDDRIDFGNGPTALDGDHTVCAWAKADTLTGQDMIFNYGDGWAVMGNLPQPSPNQFGVYHFDTANRFISFGTNFTGTFAHFAMTYDDSTNELKGYLDGVLQGTTTSQGPGATNQDYYIGYVNSDFSWDGVVDDLRIYDTVLTDQQILDIYNATEP